MRPSLRAAAASLALLSACARDASLPPPPPPPGPGTIQGRVVYAVPGQATRVAAAGAQVGILGTNLSTVTESDGRFFLGGVTQTDGILLLQLSTDGSGTPNRQAVLQLAQIKAGPGRDIALGDVPVVENAAVQGRVTLGDVGTPGGHSGTLVFVPQGPFLTQTGDDGSYSLPDLPAGTVTLSFFHDRYTSETIDGMALTAGQSYTVRDIALQPMAAGPPSPGTIAGTVTAPGGNVSAALVSASSATGSSAGPVSPDATGAFALSAPAGVYSVSVELAGFTTANVGNVLVAPGGTIELAIALTATPAVCTAGVACSSGCTVGQVTCPGGSSGPVTCSATGFVMNGTPCGAGLTCQAGSCLPACNPGVACQAANACHAATVSCTTGVAVCQEIAPTQLLPPGTTCGPFEVCSAAGACVACSGGTACTLPPPANPCHAATIDCSTGAPVCRDTLAALAPGTPCGANQVCDASATCVACQAGAVCTPSGAPCHSGAISCATGAPVCNDTGTSAIDGTVCGTNAVCHGGSCGACNVGAPCDGLAGDAAPPASPNVCVNYLTSCTTGLPVCVAGSSKPDNTVCGTNLVCHGGVCAAPGNGLRVVTAPSAMHALPNQPLAVTLQLVDTGGNPVTISDTVTVTPPADPAAPALSGARGATGATSAVDGTVTLTIALGRATGVQTFRATAPSAIVPLDFAATADVPADGTLIPLAGEAHAYGYSLASGAAPGLAVTYPYGVAVASDGTAYFADTYACVVKRIDPAGALTVIAGTGSCTFDGLSGPATMISFSYPYGIALDEARSTLYVADQGNERVRGIDLAGGTTFTVAGDGTTGTPDQAPGYGDGGPALSAQLYVPQEVAVGPESPPAIYVADNYHERIRRVDPSTHVITTFVPSTSSCASTGPLALQSLSGGTTGGSMAFDENGNLFLSGHFCGGQTGGVSIPGVARRDPDGTLTLVAGAQTGVAASGVPALSVQLADEPAIALDFAQTAGVRHSNLFLSVPNGNYVARVDGSTGRFDLVLGTGAPTVSGDFGPAVAATRYHPWGIAVRPGGRDLYVAEAYSYSVSMVAGAGSPSSAPASLAAASPLSTIAYPSQQLAAPLGVVLKDGSGAALSSYPVSFALDPAHDPGGWIASPTGTTAADGTAGVVARPGLAVGKTYGVVASFRDPHGHHATGSPVAFTVATTAPPALTVFAAVNAAHGSGFSGVPGPGAVAIIYGPRGIAVASDGTVYFSDSNNYLYEMAPTGLLAKIGGNGSYTPADGGPALASGMSPYGLALDEAGRQLYFADAYNGRVRRIDLSPASPTFGFVFTVAGGGATNADGPALSTNFNFPTRVGLVGGNAIYVSDFTSNADRLRRVDLGTTTAACATPPCVETILPRAGAGTNCSGTGPPLFWMCYGDPGCSTAAAPDGRVYVSGYFCGTGTGSTGGTVIGIARIELDGSLTYVAGHNGNGIFSGQAAGNTGFDYLPTLATDPAGNLWFTKHGGTPAVGYFQATAGVVDNTSLLHVMGDAANPPSDAYLLAGQTSFSYPMDVAVGAHAFVADWSSSFQVDAIRVIW